MNKDNTLLGSFRVKGIPSAPKEQEEFTVTFDVDADGILKVTAENKSTGKYEVIQTGTAAAGCYSDEEINNLIMKAEIEKASDEKYEKLALAKDRLESLSNELSLKSQSYPREQVKDLLEMIASHRDWLEDSCDEDLRLWFDLTIQNV